VYADRGCREGQKTKGIETGHREDEESLGIRIGGIMTIEEKVKALEKMCEEQCGCVECVLKDRPNCIRHDTEETMKIMLENYDMVFGTKSDSVDHPAHYQGKNECIDVMVAMFGKEAVKHFCMCNAYKYRYRADKKNGEEDIAKAEWYETKLIELGGVDES
jgi:hypothetical protein